eukprot:CAMPEP_0180565836 /NCGR_PEP_ID=MMETSP1037_2-20121125/5760_2 /TAXON_ID=632150 /ORGANISM="Azadinium spinosum, Strain 3D9" /LENGTH=51 /DNA_ID=CAMNT_0022582837 /DNA_START=6 /DNA_END=161 /DNA_ORIENTATION=-
MAGGESSATAPRSSPPAHSERLTSSSMIMKLTIQPLTALRAPATASTGSPA